MNARGEIDQQQQLEQQKQQQPAAADAPPAKNWQVWPGRNVFFCDGALMAGPELKNMLITFLLILVPGSLFIIFPYVAFL